MARKRKAARPGETAAATEARMMREYSREYLMRWHATAVHIVGHLASEAEQMEASAARDPAGPFAALGTAAVGRYATALDFARSALGDMRPPILTPILLSSVVDNLAELRRAKPWEGGEA